MGIRSLGDSRKTLKVKKEKNFLLIIDNSLLYALLIEEILLISFYEEDGRETWIK